MSTNVRAANAAFRSALSAASAIETASSKLASATAKLVEAFNGDYTAAQKWLGSKLPEGSNWKTEREGKTALWSVYNAVSAAKSRDKAKTSRKPRQTGKAGDKADNKADKAGDKASQPATRPATPAELVSALLLLDLESLTAAFRDQTAVTTALAVDRLRAVADALDAPAPRKRAPRKTAK